MILLWPLPVKKNSDLIARKKGFPYGKEPLSYLNFASNEPATPKSSPKFM